MTPGAPHIQDHRQATINQASTGKVIMAPPIREIDTLKKHYAIKKRELKQARKAYRMKRAADSAYMSPISSDTE